MSTLAHLRVAAAPKAAARLWLGAGLIALGAALALNSVLGPFVLGVADANVTETLRNQMIGLDAASLLLAAPLAVVAGMLVLRGRVAGPVLALGVGSYTAYMLVQYIVGPEYLGLPGDSALLFPLYLVLFALGWATALAAWQAIDTGRLPQSHRRDRLVGCVVLPLLGFLAFSRYAPALADAMSDTPTDSGYLAGPAFFWTIALLDLGVFLPATAAACVGLVRGSAWARKAMYLVAGWFGLVGPAVAAMSIAMYLNDDPLASGWSTGFMSALGLCFALLALALYRPLFAEERRSR